MEEKAKSTGGEAPRFRLENFLGRVEDEKEVRGSPPILFLF